MAIEVFDEVREQMIAKFMRVFNCSRIVAVSQLRFHLWSYEAASDSYWRDNILIY